MSIRLRLALCYGALFAVILPLLTLLSYAIHARGQYDDLDRTLVASASHAVAEASISASGPHLVQGRGSLEIVLRLYNSAGVLQESTPGTGTLPSVDPRAILHAPAGPAYDALAQLVPSFTGASPASLNGALGCSRHQHSAGASTCFPSTAREPLRGTSKR